ncbi:MAG: glycyl radical enzyme domain-containing protein, partial [Cetobacterium sp.]
MILDTIKSQAITFEQKVITLARLAESSLEVLNKSESLKKYIEDGIICDLFEGNAPYRPRYIVPDYDIFMNNGSKFLNIEKPTNIWEAVHGLLILY